MSSFDPTSGPIARSAIHSPPVVAAIPASELLALEGFPDDSDAIIYASGSLVSGYGNAWSDLDVYVIGTRPPQGPYQRLADTNSVSQHFIGARRVDYEFWRPENVKNLAARVKEFELGSGKTLAGATFLHIEQCFIHRLWIGLPLLNPSGFSRCRGWFDIDRFRSIQVEEAIRQLDELLQDVCGMIEAGDLETALFAARDLTAAAADALCHHLGNTDPCRKWRAKHLRRFGGSMDRHAELVSEFWRLQFPILEALRRDPAAARQHLLDCVKFANRIVVLVQG